MNSETLTAALPESEPLARFDVLVPLPMYPYPIDRNRWHGLEGIGEQLAWGRKDHPSGLGLNSRLVDFATALMLNHGDSDTVFTLTRPIRSYMDQPYTTLMSADIRKYTRLMGLETSVTYLSEDVAENKGSFDLMSELQVIAQETVERNWQRVALITDEPHGKRVNSYIWRLPYRLRERLSVIKLEEVLCNREYVPARDFDKVSRLRDNYLNSPFWLYWSIYNHVALHTQGLSTKIAQLTR